MKVYVLESGCYDNRGIIGVFSTPELAMARWPAPSPPPRDPKYSYTWHPTNVGGSHRTEWIFDADWDDAARVFVYELDEMEH